MGLIADMRLIAHLVRGMPRGEDDRSRLDAFYAGQASEYDQFRERLLHGRAETYAQLAAQLPDGATVVELGGGTGRNLEFLDETNQRIRKIWLVDLCPSLLACAERRVQAHGWNHVQLVNADACTWRPPAQVDAVVCSYSLTMIPNWFAAVDSALSMLKPNGLFAACDFYVSRRRPEPGLAPHGFFTRHVLPAWFAHDGVYLNPDHLPYQRQRFSEVWRRESTHRLPWLPFSAPWYGFLGRNKAADVLSG